MDFESAASASSAIPAWGLKRIGDIRLIHVTRLCNRGPICQAVTGTVVVPQLLLAHLQFFHRLCNVVLLHTRIALEPAACSHPRTGARHVRWSCANRQSGRSGTPADLQAVCGLLGGEAGSNATDRPRPANKRRRICDSQPRKKPIVAGAEDRRSKLSPQFVASQPRYLADRKLSPTLRQRSQRRHTLAAEPIPKLPKTSQRRGSRP